MSESRHRDPAAEAGVTDDLDCDHRPCTDWVASIGREAAPRERPNLRVHQHDVAGRRAIRLRRLFGGR